MEANAHCAANPTEACPAKWTPREKTLPPQRLALDGTNGEKWRQRESTPQA
jgi:alkyl hydroperoxide reductase subunit AhpC